MKTYRIATIPGDGIGKEVVPAARDVLHELARSLGGRTTGGQQEDGRKENAGREGSHT